MPTKTIKRVDCEVRRPLDAMTRVLVGLLLFLGVSAVGGGVAMLIAPDGAVIGMDAAMLADVPLIDDWSVPGLCLALVLGAGSLITAWSVIRQPHLRWAAALERATGVHASWASALAVGVVLVAFILYEARIVTAPEGRWLHIRTEQRACASLGWRWA